MVARPSRQQLVAVDTNVLFDLANELDDVVDAVSLIKQRLSSAQFLIPPTVQQELASWAFQSDFYKQEVARKAINICRLWSMVPANFMPVRHGIAERIAEQIRERGLIPPEEVNDSLVLAEAALLECSLLLTSDEHLRGIDFEYLTLELRAFDASAPIIATPREIVRKFF
jgi:predicted nucleic acid-binding protein